MIELDKGVADAADRVRELFFTQKAKFPDHVVEKLTPILKTGSSPVDMIVAFTRAVQANTADVPKEALELAAATANMIDADNYHGRLDGNALAISKALRRESGEKAPGTSKWPKKEDDPAVDQTFTKPGEPATPGEAAAPPPVPKP